MAGDIRGSDLNSWWHNRAAYRQEIERAVDQWHQASARLTKGADGAKPSAVANPPNETLDQFVARGEEALGRMRAVKGELASVDKDRERAQAEFSGRQNAIQSQYYQRIRSEQEAANRKAYESHQRAQKGASAVRKVAAIALFALVIFILVKF